MKKKYQLFDLNEQKATGAVKKFTEAEARLRNTDLLASNEPYVLKKVA